MTDIIEKIELLEAKYGITGTKEGFKEELKKLFQKKLDNQKKEMIERIEKKRHSEQSILKTSHVMGLIMVEQNSILDDIIQTINKNE